MDIKQTIAKLEDDLSYFMIGEIQTRDADSKERQNIYRYRGLALIINPDQKKQEKTITVRIGALEAEFDIEKTKKCGGGFGQVEEKLISIWLSKQQTRQLLLEYFRQVRKQQEDEFELTVKPFDFESFKKTEEEN